MKKNMSFSMAAIVAMGAILASCAKIEVAGPEPEIEKEQEPGTEIKDNILTVTTIIGRGENDATKALSIDYEAKTLTKTFADDDQVALVYENTSDQLVKAVATAENISGDGKSANFSFTMVNPKADQTVYYYYPAALVNESAQLAIPIETQDGTLSNVESLDYAYNIGIMSESELPASVKLENKFAIVAFTLKDETGANDITSTITGMAISDGIDTYRITRQAAVGPIYVVMRPIADKPLTITATGGGKNYTKSVTAKTYSANNFYQQGLRMAEMHPLTVEALTAGTVKVNIGNGSGTLSSGMKYSVNGGAKTTITTTTSIAVSAGDKVQFYGNGTATQVYGDNPEVKIQGDGAGFTCKAYGNIMSLLDEENFATKTDLPNQTFVFWGLFYGNTALTDASTLLLPATTLAKSCYNSMFRDCKALTAAPALPATTLVENCYYEMFRDCKALTAAPALPATTLATSCYYSMFDGCSALTAAPALPATTLVQTCYDYMFNGCSNLSSVTCLATEGINQNGSTTNWLDGVAASGTFTAATDATWPEGVNGIPSGWTRKKVYRPLAEATAEDVGKVVCADGHLHDAKTAVPAGCTAVGILGKVTETGHGLILALQDATSQTWNTINGWTPTTDFAGGTTLKVLPDAARGSLTSYTKLGDTFVSNWAVAQKNDYEAIFTNLGSKKYDNGYTYDANVNAYITTGVGGTAISYRCWSATENGKNSAWGFLSDFWNANPKGASSMVRPVLGF